MKVLWVVREGTGLARALNLTITISQQAEHEQRDGRDEPEQEVMEPDDVVHDRGGARLQPELPGMRLAGRRAARKRRACENGRACDHAKRSIA